MDKVILSTEATRVLAMVCTGLGAGGLIASSLPALRQGDFATFQFRAGLGFSVFAIVLMLRAMMPA